MAEKKAAKFTVWLVALVLCTDVLIAGGNRGAKVEPKTQNTCTVSFSGMMMTSSAACQPQKEVKFSLPMLRCPSGASLKRTLPQVKKKSKLVINDREITVTEKSLNRAFASSSDNPELEYQVEDNARECYLDDLPVNLESISIRDIKVNESQMSSMKVLIKAKLALERRSFPFDFELHAQADSVSYHYDKVTKSAKNIQLPQASAFYLPEEYNYKVKTNNAVLFEFQNARGDDLEVELKSFLLSSKIGPSDFSGEPMVFINGFPMGAYPDRSAVSFRLPGLQCDFAKLSEARASVEALVVSHQVLQVDREFLDKRILQTNRKLGQKFELAIFSGSAECTLSTLPIVLKSVRLLVDSVSGARQDVIALTAQLVFEPYFFDRKLEAKFDQKMELIYETGVQVGTKGFVRFPEKPTDWEIINTAWDLTKTGKKPIYYTIPKDAISGIAFSDDSIGHETYWVDQSHYSVQLQRLTIKQNHNENEPSLEFTAKRCIAQACELNSFGINERDKKMRQRAQEEALQQSLATRLEAIPILGLSCSSTTVIVDDANEPMISFKGFQAGNKEKAYVPVFWANQHLYQKKMKLSAGSSQNCTLSGLPVKLKSVVAAGSTTETTPSINFNFKLDLAKLDASNDGEIDIMIPYFYLNLGDNHRFVQNREVRFDFDNSIVWAEKKIKALLADEGNVFLIDENGEHHEYNIQDHRVSNLLDGRLPFFLALGNYRSTEPADGMLVEHNGSIEILSEIDRSLSTENFIFSPFAAELDGLKIQVSEINVTMEGLISLQAALLTRPNVQFEVKYEYSFDSNQYKLSYQIIDLKNSQGFIKKQGQSGFDAIAMHSLETSSNGAIVHFSFETNQHIQERTDADKIYLELLSAQEQLKRGLSIVEGLTLNVSKSEIEENNSIRAEDPKLSFYGLGALVCDQAESKTSPGYYAHLKKKDNGLYRFDSERNTGESFGLEFKQSGSGFPCQFLDSNHKKTGISFSPSRINFRGDELTLVGYISINNEIQFAQDFEITWDISTERSKLLKIENHRLNKAYMSFTLHEFYVQDPGTEQASLRLKASKCPENTDQCKINIDPRFLVEEEQDLIIGIVDYNNDFLSAVDEIWLKVDQQPEFSVKRNKDWVFELQSFEIPRGEKLLVSFDIWGSRQTIVLRLDLGFPRLDKEKDKNWQANRWVEVKPSLGMFVVRPRFSMKARLLAGKTEIAAHLEYFESDQSNAKAGKAIKARSRVDYIGDDFFVRVAQTQVMYHCMVTDSPLIVCKNNLRATQVTFRYEKLIDGALAFGANIDVLGVTLEVIFAKKPKDVFFYMGYERSKRAEPFQHVTKTKPEPGAGKIYQFYFLYDFSGSVAIKTISGDFAHFSYSEQTGWYVSKTNAGRIECSRTTVYDKSKFPIFVFHAAPKLEAGDLLVEVVDSFNEPIDIVEVKIPRKQKIESVNHEFAVVKTEFEKSIELEIITSESNYPVRIETVDSKYQLASDSKYRNAFFSADGSKLTLLNNDKVQVVRLYLGEEIYRGRIKLDTTKVVEAKDFITESDLFRFGFENSFYKSIAITNLKKNPAMHSFQEGFASEKMQGFSVKKIDQQIRLNLPTKTTINFELKNKTDFKLYQGADISGKSGSTSRKGNLLVSKVQLDGPFSQEVMIREAETYLVEIFDKQRSIKCTAYIKQEYYSFYLEPNSPCFESHNSQIGYVQNTHTFSIDSLGFDPLKLMLGGERLSGGGITVSAQGKELGKYEMNYDNSGSLIVFSWDEDDIREIAKANYLVDFILDYEADGITYETSFRCDYRNKKISPLPGSSKSISQLEFNTAERYMSVVLTTPKVEKIIVEGAGLTLTLEGPNLAIDYEKTYKLSELTGFNRLFAQIDNSQLRCSKFRVTTKADSLNLNSDSLIIINGEAILSGAMYVPVSLTIDEPHLCQVGSQSQIRPSIVEITLENDIAILKASFCVTKDSHCRVMGQVDEQYKFMTLASTSGLKKVQNQVLGNDQQASYSVADDETGIKYILIQNKKLWFKKENGEFIDASMSSMGEAESFELAQISCAERYENALLQPNDKFQLAIETGKVSFIGPTNQEFDVKFDNNVVCSLVNSKNIITGISRSDETIVLKVRRTEGESESLTYYRLSIPFQIENKGLKLKTIQTQLYLNVQDFGPSPEASPQSVANSVQFRDRLAQELASSSIDSRIYRFVVSKKSLEISPLRVRSSPRGLVEVETCKTLEEVITLD